MKFDGVVIVEIKLTEPVAFSIVLEHHESDVSRREVQSEESVVHLKVTN